VFDSGQLKWGTEVEKISHLCQALPISHGRSRLPRIGFPRSSKKRHNSKIGIPYNNPIWVVDKKGTEEAGNRNKRLVIDFCKLNERTITDKHPMPNISMILSNLGNAHYFSTLDLKSGYHQFVLAERKYEFKRLPFGLRNAASIFQRTIDDILREQIGKLCYVYVDLIIFSQD